MFQLTCHIIIGSLEFDYVHSVEIESSWKAFTDKCKISLPKNLYLRDKALDEIIKPGQAVSVRLGYDYEFAYEFTGYVARSPQMTIPFVVDCEDNMWLLKQGTVSKSWASVSLKEVLKEIIPAQFTIDSVDADLGPFRINKATPAKVLEKLKETYGLYSYFKGNTLYVGKVRMGGKRVVKYHFQKNIISHSLEWKKKDEVQLKVKAISMLDDNSKLEVEVGETEGDAEEHTLHFYNIRSKPELEKRATAEMEKLRYDGFRGSFESFGSPYLEHNDIATLQDDEYPEMNGNYYVDKVQVKFGMEGFRRTIELGSRA